MNRFYGLVPAICGALFLGTLSTIGDMIWDTWIRSHRLLFGLIHGALICLAIGLVLGWASGGGRPAKARGVLIAPLIGVLAAGSFYLFAIFMGYAAMFVSWVLLWILCAWLYQSLLMDPVARWAFLVRGLIAAILSGLAFYSISGIWTDPPADPNYLIYCAYWTFAFFPAFLILFLERPTRGT